MGTNNQYDGEGYDRPFDLPEFQGELIQNLANVNPRTIVITHGGGSFDAEPWINQVRGLIQAFYPGQNGGQAIAEILFGAVNPSGKLPISWEKLAQDNPASATFPMPLNQHPTTMYYSEGIFIGYRGYEKNHIQPLFPFGFGLSYTSFAFSDLKIEPAVFNGHEPVRVSFTVTNTGKRAGAEVAELYVGQQSPTIVRPIKELKGFEKVNLNPGQSTRVTLSLDQRSFAYFNTAKEKWDAVPGVYNVVVGDSSDDTPTQPVKVSFTVTNSGKRAGAEVAELYVGQENPKISRPIKELKGFEKVYLQPGQSKTVTLELNQRSFAYFNTATEKWDALPGSYNVLVGGSSEDTPLKGQVSLKSEFTAKP